MKLVVEIENLTVKFGDFTAVNKISFGVSAGEIFAFLGANGAGKTTTIRVLCGLLKPSSGVAKVLGREVKEENFYFIKNKVGYMSQKFTLYNDLTVEENLSFLADLRKIDRQTYYKRKSELLDFISFNKPLNTLSADLPAGMKQQVSLVAALIHDPEIIFLDEPTAGVGPKSRLLFWNLIKELAKRGKTIFVTSHYMDEVEKCERVSLMRAGEIIALDSPANLKTKVFPQGIIQLIPNLNIGNKEAREFSQEIIGAGIFSSFVQHGVNFHVTVSNPEKWMNLQKETKFQNIFQVSRIDPSLEDVFVQLVEGKNR